MAIGAAAVLVLGLLFVGGSALQHSAYMEGYMMGRLSAPVVAAAAPAAGVAAPLAVYGPYAPYGLGAPHWGPPFSGILFLLLGAGLLFFVMTRIARRAAWKAWAVQQGLPADAWRHGPPPWMHGWACPSAAQPPAATQPGGEQSEKPEGER